MRSRRRRLKDNAKGAPAWLTSATDLMTNMMSVFALLFSFAIMANQVASQAAASSANDGSKQQEIAIVTGEAGKNVLENGGTYEDSTKGNGHGEAKDQTAHFIEALQRRINELGLQEQLAVFEMDDDGTVLIRARDSALFRSARADIEETAETILTGISLTLYDYTDIITTIRIEGHSDNRPISNQYFKSNWELSTMRAVNVLQRLHEISLIDPALFSAVGYGEFHPVSDNNTEEGRAQNRRVDFIIETKTTAQRAYEYFYATQPASLPAENP